MAHDDPHQRRGNGEAREGEEDKGPAAADGVDRVLNGGDKGGAHEAPPDVECGRDGRRAAWRKIDEDGLAG